LKDIVGKIQKKRYLKYLFCFISKNFMVLPFLKTFWYLEIQAFSEIFAPL